MEDPNEEQVGLAVETFKLLADNTRLRILWALLHGEHSVNNLADHVSAQPSTVSQHLAKLRMARIVKVRREGTYLWYSANADTLEELLGFLYAECCTRNKAIAPQKIVCCK